MKATSTKPFFPGFTDTQKEKPTYLKKQNFKVVAGLMQTRTPDPSIIDLQIEDTRRRLEAVESDSRRYDLDTTVPYTPDYNEIQVPEVVVLRFFAFFKQSLTEAMDETYRVRYVRIYFYVEDETIMVEEHKERNAGMDQGVLLKRMRVQNPNAQNYGDWYHMNDFNVGIDVDIAAMVYHIYDCDQFTREFLRSNGFDVMSNEMPPDDLYTCKRRLTERPIRVTYIDTDKTHLRDFLDYDGKVLRFYSIWDDSRSIFGEKRKFIVHYFLVDHTIEIRQCLPPNSGRDPVSQFLKKTLLKKPGQASYYTDADLQIGTRIDVFGRTFLLYDADDFTRHFLDQRYGPHDWSPIPVDDPDYYSTSKRQDPPPYNGWGDEEDSLGYCYSLHPVPPKKNIVKLLAKDGQILRFAAKFIKPTPQDVGREFVIAYYLADDSVAVFEKPRRNSGFREGKFIQKAKIKNPKTGTFFNANEFRIGGEVTINGYEFIIVNADEWALRTMEAEADEFPQADLFDIFERIKGMRKQTESLRRQFELRDQEQTGYVPQNDAQARIQKMYGLQQHESLTVVRRWTNERGFDYFDFMSVFDQNTGKKSTTASTTRRGMQGKVIISLMGGPGVGKGTQSDLICQHYNVGYMSAGDLLRKASSEDTPLGRQLAEQLRVGAIVAQEVTIGLLKQEIERQNKDFFIIDGFPRKPEQAQAFEQMVCPFAACIYIEAPDDVLVKHLLKRANESEVKRSDDNEESIKLRLKVFHEQSCPVFDYFDQTNRTYRVNGNRTVPEVFKDIQAVLDRIVKK